MLGELKCVSCENSVVEQLSLKIRGTFPIVKCGRCGMKFILSDSFEALDDDEYWDDINRRIYQMPAVLKEIQAKHSKFLRKITNNRPPNNQLLDVGCGNGIFLNSAADAGFDPTGIEPSPIAIELCRELYSISPVCGYLQKDSDLAKTFGTLTAWDVIEHVADPKAFVEICHAHLDKGGLLLLETPDESSLVRKFINWVSPFLPGRSDLRQRIYYVHHRYYFTPKSLKKLLENSGFEDVQVFKGHTIFAKSLAKLKLYRKYSPIQMLKYKIIFTLLKLPFFTNKQIVLARKKG